MNDRNFSIFTLNLIKSYAIDYFILSPPVSWKLITFQSIENKEIGENWTHAKFTPMLWIFYAWLTTNVQEELQFLNYEREKSGWICFNMNVDSDDNLY